MVAVLSFWGATGTWPESSRFRAGVIVAIIDTGIDYTHPDLRDSMWVNPHEIPGNGIDDDGNGIVDEPSRLA